jgi:hypothetical protein
MLAAAAWHDKYATTALIIRQIALTDRRLSEIINQLLEIHLRQEQLLSSERYQGGIFSKSIGLPVFEFLEARRAEFGCCYAAIWRRQAGYKEIFANTSDMETGETPFW